ncbi:diacylglycerol kinase family protein [Limosilactobacillus sp.]|uniref:diacylglycerol kinase family protein n=1 Tax=Limosilactobacillus sp. TaxID=2773925 RepID=UPI00345E5629
MDSKDKQPQTGKNHNLWQAMGHAVDGIFQVIQSERNMRFHLASAVVVIIAGFICRISFDNWLWLIAAIFAVMSAEMINTISEWLCDLVVGSHFHPLVKKIKDAAAGMVLLVALFAFIIGLLIFVPAIIKLLEGF